jgi:hypothetical protein
VPLAQHHLALSEAEVQGGEELGAGEAGSQPAVLGAHDAAQGVDAHEGGERPQAVVAGGVLAGVMLGSDGEELHGGLWSEASM